MWREWRIGKLLLENGRLDPAVKHIAISQLEAPVG